MGKKRNLAKVILAGIGSLPLFISLALCLVVINIVVFPYICFEYLVNREWEWFTFDIKEDSEF